MTDVEAATDRINEVLAEENERLKQDLLRTRALLERPVTVNIQSSDAATLKKVGEYLPQLTHLASNVATVGGELIQARKHAETHGKALLESQKKLDQTMRRIAAALERAYPIPEEDQ